jgi:Family of unknown function (DUF6516)
VFDANILVPALQAVFSHARTRTGAPSAAAILTTFFSTQPGRAHRPMRSGASSSRLHRCGRRLRGTPPAPAGPRGLKYRLYCGRGGDCLVRYDNETGKSDHRHVRGREMSYEFRSVEQLRRDFERDVKTAGGKDEENT